MDTMTYTDARAKLASAIDRVCQDHSPLIITRKGDAAVIMLSLEDYRSLEETAYLLRSPKNTRRLLKSIDQLEKGKGKIKTLSV